MNGLFNAPEVLVLFYFNNRLHCIIYILIEQFLLKLSGILFPVNLNAIKPGRAIHINPMINVNFFAFIILNKSDPDQYSSDINIFNQY